MLVKPPVDSPVLIAHGIVDAASHFRFEMRYEKLKEGVGELRARPAGCRVWETPSPRKVLSSERERRENIPNAT